MPGKIFVTGGCGFFGAWIIKRLLDDGDQVVVFDAVLFTKRWEMLMTQDEIAKIKFIQGKVDEDGFVNTIVDEAPDAIIHLAGLQVPTCREHPILGAKVNVIGTLNVFEAAKALKSKGATVPRIVYASSAAVFGPDAEYGEAPVGDSAVPKPTSHYGAYKLCTEYCAKAYHVSNGISSVGLRPLTVYGPGRDAGMTSAPTRAIAAAIKGQQFTIPFTGSSVYISIREVADIFVNTARKDPGGAYVYTVGGDTVDTHAWIAAVEEALGPASKGLITASGGPIPFPSKLDDASLRADFPGLLRISISQGVAETVAAYKKLEAEGKLTV